jgi:hypothetical protein
MRSMSASTFGSRPLASTRTIGAGVHDKVGGRLGWPIVADPAGQMVDDAGRRREPAQELNRVSSHRAAKVIVAHRDNGQTSFRCARQHCDSRGQRMAHLHRSNTRRWRSRRHTLQRFPASPRAYCTPRNSALVASVAHGEATCTSTPRRQTFNRKYPAQGTTTQPCGRTPCIWPSEPPRLRVATDRLGRCHRRLPDSEFT